MTTTQGERTITYRSVTHRRQAEAAVQLVASQTATRQGVLRILNLDGRRAADGSVATAERIIGLSGGSWIVEIENALGQRGRILFAVIVNGENTRALYETLDLALLAYVGRRHSGMELDALVHGAGRMLCL